MSQRYQERKCSSRSRGRGVSCEERTRASLDISFPRGTDRESTGIDLQDAIGKAVREPRLMQRAHDRHVSRMRDLAHQGQDRNRRAGVKTRYRFIRKQNPALLRKCARYRNPLLLPARQRVGALSQVGRRETATNSPGSTAIETSSSATRVP
jgi:hypothetical protein